MTTAPLNSSLDPELLTLPASPGDGSPNQSLPTFVNKRILLVDDNPAIHADFHKVLNPGNRGSGSLAEAEAALFGEATCTPSSARFELESAYQGQEALQKVQASLACDRPYALAFLDVRMPPGWDGVETLTRIWKIYPELQVVICTAYSDYSWDEMIAKVGSPDNLVLLKKPFDAVEVLQLAHTLTRKWELNRQAQLKMDELQAMVHERTRQLERLNLELRREVQERIQAEKGLRLSEERFSHAFKASPIALSIQTLDELRYVDANDAFLKLTGHARADVLGRTASELRLWANPASLEQILRESAAGKATRNLECQLQTKTGDLRQTLVSTQVLTLQDQPHVLILAEDITERVQLERQFRQAQKMEAIGQLAAGVAHDFNNILTVIQGYASMLQLQLGEEGVHNKAVSAILTSSERATNLVRQLLLFSRKRIMEFRSLDLNETLRSLSTMLRQLVGEHIALETDCQSDLPPVHADRGMLEQVIVNLTVNARDAIGKHGTIRLSSTLVDVDGARAQGNSEARLGQFVCLTVSDTGCGIPAQAMPHLFEPFFTTKEIGRGTGLGLATIYGIVRQHQGWIEVATQEGVGTSFRVYLPRSCQSATSTAETPSAGPRPVGTETILLAEDEPFLRDMVVDTLQSCGYTVLAANSGPAAVEIWHREQGRIHLLLTDMVMPGGMMGTDLAAELRRLDAKLRVILSTGYSPGAHSIAGPLRDGMHFLPKPYSPHKLATLVRQALDS